MASSVVIATKLNKYKYCMLLQLQEVLLLYHRWQCLSYTKIVHLLDKRCSQITAITLLNKLAVVLFNRVASNARFNLLGLQVVFGGRKQFSHCRIFNCNNQRKKLKAKYFDQAHFLLVSLTLKQLCNSIQAVHFKHLVSKCVPKHLTLQYRAPHGMQV